MLNDVVGAPLALEHYAEELRRMADARLKWPLRGRLNPSDLVQQTLLIAHRKREQFRGTTHAGMRGWLRSILKRQLARAARRFVECAPERATSLDGLPGGPAFGQRPDLVDKGSSIARRAARAERWLALNAAVAALPEDQRAALELHYFEGLSVVEVARRMGRTTASVAGLLHRALKSLREVLA